jgi:MOSC domain-containing protein YiiM
MPFKAHLMDTTATPLDSAILPEPASDLPTWDARLLKIYISPGHDYWGKQGEGRLQHGIQEVSEVECIPGRGLLGDRYFHKRPGHKGQVTFFDAAVVEEVRREFKLPKLPASIFRRNLIVQGINLGDWRGKRFLFQGIEFEGSQECKPCHWMDRVIAEGAEAFLKPHYRGGLRAMIRTPGVLRVG